MEAERFFKTVWIGAVCVAGVGCSVDSGSPVSPSGTGPPRPPSIAVVSLLGNAQSGVVGQSLPEAVGVRLSDQDGAPVSGTMVKFAVGGGGGSIDADSAPTDARGEARTRWTLGVDASADHRLTATVPGYATGIPALRASGLPGPPAEMVIVSGDTQAAMIGMALTAPLRVRLTDAFANPTRFVRVAWSPSPGDGWVTADTTLTDWDGIAQIERTLGPDLGYQGTEAALVGGSLPSVLFASTAVPLVSAYDIDLRFVGPMPPNLEAAIRSAAARWSRIIVGDVPSASPSAFYDWCALDRSWLPAVVDDISIIVQLDSVDGPGGSLGWGYPCIDRQSLKTQVGTVVVDVSDLPALEATGALEAVVLRAVGHAIGFGSLWAYLNPPLATGSVVWNPAFIGRHAIRQFNLSRGASLPRASVPIEVYTGPGDWTWMAPGEYPYWSEYLMGSELMTSIVNPGLNPLSTITIATFADMGYTVSYATADPYTVGGSGQAIRPADISDSPGMRPGRSAVR